MNLSTRSRIINIILTIFSTIFVFIMLCAAILPIIWIFTGSFKTNAEIFSGSLGFPETMSLKNYEKALRMAPIIQFYGNSIFIAFSTMALNIFIVSLSSYVLSRFQFKGREAIRTLLTSSLMIPAAALLLPLYLTITRIGLYNTLTGLILAYSAFNIPVSLYVLTSYYLTIPMELEDAAYIDGAGFYRTFFTIIAPLAKPAMATCGVLAFLGAWNEFQFALTLTTTNSKRTLPIALQYFKSQFSSDYGAMFAATMLVVLPSIIVFIVMQEQVTSGLVSGAVKG